MSVYIIEACVETRKELENAVNQGVERIELCSHLDKDGLTPTKKMIDFALSFPDLHVKVMIRPREGDFCYSLQDIRHIQKDIKICHNLGIEEIVFGAIKNNRIDVELVSKVAQWAKPMKITIHKAIDVSIDPLNDILALKTINGIRAILSSGQKTSAAEGYFMLSEMKRVCGEDLELIPAGKITPVNINELHQKLGARSYHGRRIV